MSKRQQWKGPFRHESAFDGTCVKCERRGEYRMNFLGIEFWCCREHAIEGLCSQGGRTPRQAAAEIAQIDADRWRSLNTHTLCWIPVNERLPEVGVTVLGWDRDGYHTLHVYCGKSKRGTDVWFSSNVAGGEYEDARSGSEPAFWMPLPAPPKATP